MNPFLERSWGDVHTLMIGYIRDDLARRGLPPGLRARAEESLTVEEIGDAPRRSRADVALVESWRQGVAPAWTPEEDAQHPVVLA